jgi:chemotaxis receptor (MCP) glutamine deamidase CheD
MTIGNDNVAEVKSKLKELNIPITAEIPGGPTEEVLVRSY